MYKSKFYLKNVNKILRHCHSWLSETLNCRFDNSDVEEFIVIYTVVLYILKLKTKPPKALYKVRLICIEILGHLQANAM